MRAPRGPDLLQQGHGGLHHRGQGAHHHHLRVRAGGACAGGQRVGVDHGAGQVQGGVAAGALQRRSGDEKNRRHAALPGQPQRAVQQQVVCGGDAAALQPHTGDFDVLQKVPRRKGLVGVGQAQGGGVPAQEFGARRQLQRQAVFGLAVAVGNGFQRQPFQPGAGVQHGVGALQGQFARRSVKARGPRRGDEGVRAAGHLGADVQRVAAYQAAGRVYQHVVANGVAFGVQAFQDAQRAVVLVAHHGAGAFQAVIELEVGVPGHGQEV